MSYPGVLERISGELDRTGIGYMLTGSFAGVFYGRSRSTQDIDFVIEASPIQLQALLGNLPGDEYYVDVDAALDAQRRESLFNVIDKQTNWKIDFIFRKSRAFSREEFKRRQLVDMEGIALYVATPEDLVVAKLEWAKLGQSQRQVEDAAEILKLRGDSVDRGYIQKWIRDLGLDEQWAEAKRITGE